LTEGYQMRTLSFDAYTLKWIAIIGMITNHMVIGWAEILPTWSLFPLYGLGGLTYPIMAFFVVEGYRHTSNIKKYILRLFIFGAIAQIFHPLVMRGMGAMIGGILFNIMFTIILSLVVLILYDKIKVRVLFWLVFLAALGLALFMDWSFIGVIIPFMYYTIQDENKRRTRPAIVAGVIYLLLSLLSLGGIYAMKSTPGMEYELQELVGNLGIKFFMAMPTFAIGCFAAAVLLKNYNGERGKPAKWLFYIVYPLHLAVIGLIGVALGLANFSMILFQ